MEEKKIFRVRDEENMTPSIPANEEKLSSFFDSVEEDVDTVVYDAEDIIEKDETLQVDDASEDFIEIDADSVELVEESDEAENKGKKSSKGFMSQFSTAGKIAFVLGLLIILGIAGVLGYSYFSSIGDKTPAPSNNGNGSSNVNPKPSDTPVENTVTEQNATVLQLTEEAGDEYMEDLLFIGDSNYNRMYMLHLLDLDHVIGVDGMGVQSVRGGNVVYFVEKSSPITIPAAVKIMQPKTIIMNFGTNNLVAGTVDSFIENYEEAIDAIQEAYPYADIIIQSIPPIGKDLPSGYRMVDYKKVYTFNNALIKMCEDRGLHYLNVTEDVWRDQDGHCKSEYITSDGIHLEQKAYEKLLEYVRTHALLTEDTRPEITAKLTRKQAPAPVDVYQYQCDIVVTSAMESFYEAGFIDYKKTKEGEKEENYKEPESYRFTISKADAVKDSEESTGKSLFSSVYSQVKNKEKAQVAISYKATDDGGYVFTVTVKEVCKHDFQVQDEVAPTCTQPGSKTMVCKVCGKKTVTTVDKLDHEYDMSTAHDYDKTNGTMKVKCTLCGKEYDVKHGDSDHEWGESTVIEEPTCEKEGKKSAKCKICGFEQTTTIEKLGHDFSVIIESKDPTCKEKGFKKSKCSRCDETYEESISELGHDYSVFDKAVEEATCTHGGKAQYKCSRCGELDPVLRDIDKLAHDYSVFDKTVEEATCTHGGKAQYKCSGCGEPDPVLRDTPALEHPWGDWVVDAEPQVGVPGHRHRDCTQCDAHQEEDIPALEPDPTTSEGEGTG
ncbi:MAG: hypothetical protein IJH64_15025 [Oscillospiraceae bacterium]|nr:hypothetical protein [Oscillospiraceae bacterium]MBR0452128.1 hypothetical protein [Oscillospiraceae bacterium]